MSNSKAFIIVACSLILMSSSIPGKTAPTESSITSAGVSFLTIVDSPRGNGMGGCVVNLVDEQSALYNPGALGLFHLDRTLAISVPYKNKWLPDLADDMYIRTQGLSGGLSYDLLQPDNSSVLNLSLGLAYFQVGEWEKAQAELFGTEELDKSASKHPGEYTKITSWRHTKETNDRFEQCTLEGKEYSVYSMKVTVDTILSVALSARTPVGIVRYNLRRTGDTLADVWHE